MDVFLFKRNSSLWRRSIFHHSFFFSVLFIYLLYNVVLVLTYIDMNLPGCTCIPHPEPCSHPSGSSQCTSPEHPVSCIEPGVVIYFTYDNIHVSMPFSQIIPSLLFPTGSKDCSIHLCLFCCLTYRVIITIFLNSIYIYISILY